jgi:hypothetical protein
MGTVPDTYFQFVMHYAPWYYVIPAYVTSNASAGQKDVIVEDGSLFQATMAVEIKDNLNSEWNEVDSVAGNTVTMKSNFAHTYATAKNALVEHPDLTFGKGAFPAAFAIEFLYLANKSSQFSDSERTDIFAKIVELSDWLLTQQETNPAKKAYGGFYSSVGSTYCWSLDAGRAIPALLKAYEVTQNPDYLDAAKLAGYTFLYMMQHDPVNVGAVDKYYGAFVRAVTDGDAYDTIFMVEDLYDLIGLKMLAKQYDPANAARYQEMMDDAAEFYRVGMEDIYLYYQPPPYGSGVWYRVGLQDEQIYDDSFAFAILGLFTYEGWSGTCQRTYEFIQAIGASATYPGYNPAICWPGYVNVITRVPDCAYYDNVTIGILESIRKVVDAPSYELAYQIVKKYQTQFLVWGTLYTDYSALAGASKATANVSWQGRMFLNYSYPRNAFSLLLSKGGETVTLYSVIQAANTVSYAKPLEMQAVIKNGSINEILLEAGYVITDYLLCYSLIPVRPRDKIRRRGSDYQVQFVEKQVLKNRTLYYKAQLRRLQNN